jgi:hypothetical protein
MSLTITAQPRELSAPGSLMEATISNREDPDMSTTTNEKLVFTEPTTYIATPCPPYCDLKSMHPVDNEGGDNGDFRIHGGPTFGALMEGFAEEYVSAPGELKVRVWLSQEATFADPAGLRQLAADALEAAEWLEAHA